jgi:hypothetical protein
MARCSALTFAILVVLALGLGGFLIPVFILGGDDGASPASRLGGLLRSVSGRLLGRRPAGRVPADGAAAALIFRASARQAAAAAAAAATGTGALVGDDLTDVLLAVLLTGGGSGDSANVQGRGGGGGGAAGPSSQASPDAAAAREALVGSVRAAEPYWTAASAATAEDPSRRLQHDVPALFVTAACRHWPHLAPLDQIELRKPIEAAASYLSARTTRGGLYDLRAASSSASFSASSATSTDAARSSLLAASSLRQAQAVAALRCAGALLSSDDFLGAAERLRRGLFRMYLPSDEATDGGGPFDLGLAVAPEAASASAAAAAAALPDLDTLQAIRRVRGLTSDLPLMLLFLEHRDLPAAVVEEIAEASAAALATPLGIKGGRDLGGAEGNRGGAVSAAGVGAVYSVGVPWRVAPVEQAAILLGALKHMLPLSGHTAGGNVGDESGTGDASAADALSALVDVVLRIAPVLSQLEAESASRTSENVREKLVALQSGLAAEVRVKDKMRAAGLAAMSAGAGGVAARAVAKFSLAAAAAAAKAGGGAEGGASTGSSSVLVVPTPPPALASLANSTDPLAALGASAFSLTFPEYLTPLAPGDLPLDPRASALDPRTLDLLSEGSGQAGGLFRKRLAERLRGAGENGLADAADLVAKGGRAAAGSTTASGANDAVASARTTLLRHMLRSVRYPEANGLAVIRPFGGSSSADGGSPPVEHVVLDVPRHEHGGAEGAEGGGESTLLVRGDGHPLAVTSAVAAHFFRTLYEDAFTWLRARERAEREDEAARRAAGRSGAGGEGGGGKGKGFLTLQIARLRPAAGAGAGAAGDEGASGAASSSTSGGPSLRAVSSSSMLLFLTSRAADVSLLVTTFTWLREPHIARWRQMRGGKVEGAGSASAAAAAAAAAAPAPPPAGRALGDTSASPVPSAGSVLVDVTALHARLCSPAALESLGGERDRVWTGACCGEEVLALVRKAAAAGAGAGAAAARVPVSSLPTFPCAGPRRGKGTAGEGGLAAPAASDDLPPLQVSCAYARDDFCDCEGDAADEPDSSACAGSPLAPGAAFLCPSGVLEVAQGALAPHLAAPGLLPSGGADGAEGAAAAAAVLARLRPAELAAYGYIHASKVGDGVKDCVGGEDEGGE